MKYREPWLSRNGSICQHYAKADALAIEAVGEKRKVCRPRVKFLPWAKRRLSKPDRRKRGGTGGSGAAVGRENGARFGSGGQPHQSHVNLRFAHDVSAIAGRFSQWVAALADRRAQPSDDVDVRGVQRPTIGDGGEQNLVRRGAVGAVVEAVVGRVEVEAIGRRREGIAV